MPGPKVLSRKLLPIPSRNVIVPDCTIVELVNRTNEVVNVESDVATVRTWNVVLSPLTVTARSEMSPAPSNRRTEAERPEVTVTVVACSRTLSVGASERPRRTITSQSLGDTAIIVEATMLILVEP